MGLNRDIRDQAARALVAGIPVTLVAKDLGVSRRTLQRWLKDETFHELVAGARQEGATDAQETPTSPVSVPRRILTALEKRPGDLVHPEASIDLPLPKRTPEEHRVQLPYGHRTWYSGLEPETGPAPGATSWRANALHMLRCDCGWSSGWLPTRDQAEDAAARHF